MYPDMVTPSRERLGHSGVHGAGRGPSSSRPAPGYPRHDWPTRMVWLAPEIASEFTVAALSASEEFVA